MSAKNKNKKLKYKLNYNEELYSASTNDKNYDFNTISTIEKLRLTIEKLRLTKNKNVSFGKIEIIDVESYKKYNQIKILTFESIESNCLKACDNCRCIII